VTCFRNALALKRPSTDIMHYGLPVTKIRMPVS
jgi:hypothetical protein